MTPSSRTMRKEASPSHSTRDTLRRETKAIHERLDQVVAEQLKPFDSPSRYEAYLLAMQQLFVRYGASCDWASLHSGLEANAKSLIKLLGVDAKEAVFPLMMPSAVEESALSTDLPGFSESQCWGHAYVLEGSALGARMLCKIATRKLGTSSIRFLKTTAEASFERWPKFVAALDAADVKIDVVIQAAHEVFHTAYQVFVEASELIGEKA